MTVFSFFARFRDTLKLSYNISLFNIDTISRVIDWVYNFCVVINYHVYFEATIRLSSGLRDFSCQETDPLDHPPACKTGKTDGCNCDNSVQTMRRPRASGTLRIEIVFRAFVGVTSAAPVASMKHFRLTGNSRKQEPSKR